MTSPWQGVRYRRSQDFVARAIAGETVLVPIRRQIGDLESIYTLNDVATFIWERLARPTTSDEIALALDDAFAGDPAAIRSDLHEFLGALLEIGAVEQSDANGPTPFR